MAPHLAGGVDGRPLVMSWLEPEGDGRALRYATLENHEWSPPRTVAQGEQWFVNWADFPSVAPISDEVWAAHWLVKRAGGPYAYDIAVALSRDRGRSWTRSVAPHDDGTATEHGFASLFQWGDTVGAVWLDGRNMAGSDHGAGPGAMTLRSARITAGGQVTEPGLIDDRVCDCCQTDVAMTAQGPIAAYRNRTATEVRDIHVARHVAGAWQTDVAVADDGWRIEGCPVNGPAIAAMDNTVAVAWFTAPGGLPRVRMARSNDGGATFSPAIDIDADSPVGRVDVEWISDDGVAVSWLRKTAEGRGEAVVRSISRSGDLGATHVIGETTAARPSGFPQMKRYEGGLMFAWTEASEAQTVVKTAVMSTAVFDEIPRGFSAR